MFKRWVEIDNDAMKELKPDYDLGTWNDLDSQEKRNIWRHLEWYLFDFSATKYNDAFKGDSSFADIKKNRVFMTIAAINKFYKRQNYAKNFIDSPSLDTACKDFVNIFMNEGENVVYEMLSIYAKLIINERADRAPYRESEETEEDYEKRIEEWRIEPFDNFADKLNEVFTDYSINISLSRGGFVPKQDKLITESIYVPVMKILSDRKWRPVNNHIGDSISYLRDKNYSSSITNTISGLQAFLQIQINGKTGKGDISKLIKEGISKGLLPNDLFTDRIFNNLESILEKERSEKGDAHPTQIHPSEKNALLVLNLTLIFLQHSLQN